MIIVSTTTSKTNLKKPLLYLSTLGLTAILTTPILVALAANYSPTGTYLNPLPEKELAATPTTTPTESPEQLILAAQAYLERAITLSRQESQTEADKQKIVEFLNQGLNYANQAVAASPSSPQTYLVRARILASSTSLRQDATTLAQKDLETAQLLSGGQSVSLPTEVNLINYTPTEQASLASNLIIAAPEEEKANPTNTETSSNINKEKSVIKAGQTTTTIKNSAISEDSYIYLIPIIAIETPFIESKAAGQATISIISPLDTDFEFEYWIVNP